MKTKSLAIMFLLLLFSVLSVCALTVDINTSLNNSAYNSFSDFKVQWRYNDTTNQNFTCYGYTLNKTNNVVEGYQLDPSVKLVWNDFYPNGEFPSETRYVFINCTNGSTNAKSGTLNLSYTCSEDWQCDGWLANGSCSGGNRYDLQDCGDENFCGTTLNKPNLMKCNAVMYSGDTLEGLPSLGMGMGSFLKNMTGGLGQVLLTTGIFVAIVMILVAVVAVATKRFSK